MTPGARPVGRWAAAAASIVAIKVIYVGVLGPRLRTWGATKAEAEGPVAGDDLVRDRYRATHAITIARPPSEVWPWLVQMGYGRAGWYSYDRLERAAGAGDFVEGGSARRIVPELQRLEVGDTVALSAAGGAAVATVEPPRALVLHFRMDLRTGAPASVGSGAILDWTWAFSLEPAGAGSRLVIRVRADPSPALLALAFPVLAPVHLAMERKLLRTIKRRAESTSMPGPPAFRADEPVAALAGPARR
jgi:hypothetical protein